MLQGCLMGAMCPMVGRRMRDWRRILSSWRTGLRVMRWWRKKRRRGMVCSVMWRKGKSLRRMSPRQECGDCLMNSLICLLWKNMETVMMMMTEVLEMGNMNCQVKL
uniref:Uncharacterized protein n=1 Tax=Arundo donax TaxID=35708 RepID=A0A0A9ILG1_ARUDO